MKRKVFGVSLFTITCLYGLLAGIVILAVMLAGGDVLYGIIGSLIVIIIQFLISPWLTDLSMKLFYKADFNSDIPSYLKDFIEEECDKHNIIYPKIGFIDDGAPNAFTYGRTKKDARIVITRGIYDLLTEEEVKAVVAHELGHIAHMDILVMTAVQAVPLVLYAIYQVLTKREKSKSNNNDAENKAALIGYIALILYFISQYFILWLSRTREYYADDFSVTETRNPNALAEALVKIGFGLSISSSDGKNDVSSKNALGIFDKNAGKAMTLASIDGNKLNKEKIKNSMKWEMWNPWAKWFELNSTHPLISRRINKISKRSEEFNQTPYIMFDLKKPESYVDDFLLEVFIYFMPLLCILTTIILCIILKEYMDKIIVIGALLTIILSFIKFKRKHKSGYKEKTVEELLGEIKVSHVTSIPVILKGTIIGRGNPGCIFNEDFVIKDETGIMFLDYNQPLSIINTLFAIFKSKEYFDKEVIVKGWYRRSPMPYVEIYEYIVDGKKKKIWTYGLIMTLYIVGFIITALFGAALLFI